MKTIRIVVGFVVFSIFDFQNFTSKTINLKG